MADNGNRFSDREALRYHALPRPGKLEIVPTKPMATQRDLSLAYSPGVAVPVEAIAAEPDTIFDYTARGNLVAVVTNGTAILGLGNLGAAAAKPVMEGKSVLFKRFADVDAIDLEVATEDVDRFVDAVRLLEPSFGGINLEDIGAPACFIIEQKLREAMSIPVFHDDQHGTAIITAAGFINALYLTDRKAEDVRVVVNGAGAAAIACVELIKALGVPHENVVMCDSKGVIYEGRSDNMNQWKSAHAIPTGLRTLAEAMEGADVFIGLSVKDAVSQEMVKRMAKKPIIFAMANPDPEIAPEAVAAVRKDAIVATGRSDYPNQVNNVLGFPYIFRGALDVRARTINEEMKIAAAHALAELARSDVPDEVAAAYSGRRQRFGPDYIIPSPFDPRLMEFVPPRVAEAAMRSGVARKPIEDMAAYRRAVSTRLNPTVGLLGAMFDMLKEHDIRVVFAEGEEDRMLRAAIGFKSGGYGTPVLVGYEEVVADKLRELGADPDEFEIRSARSTKARDAYADWLYKRLQRRGYLKRDVLRLVNRDRNVFSACMVACGDADAMVTGLTRNYYQALDNIRLVIDPREGMQPFGLTIVMARGRTVFIADTVVNEHPTPEELADIAQNAAAAVRHLGHEPRVALLSFSNFGQPMRKRARHVREAVRLLEERDVEFEFDGEMAPDTALNTELMKLYPFCRLSGPANVLIMPALHSALISYKLVGALGGARVIGPILWGLSKPVQLVRMGAQTSEIINMAALAAVGAIDRG
ncbi:MAG: NADP-dependent malic enzyme [Alphaproteobacteria bacterium]|nr:MAG: NADP-dependent malic enzyme [Alphaproteobacteria bacterium]